MAETDLPKQSRRSKIQVPPRPLLIGLAVAVLVVGVGLVVGILVIANHSSSENRAADEAAVNHWQAQLAVDSAKPQEGYLGVRIVNGLTQVVGNDYWGQCHQDPAFVYQEDCPDAGTPQAQAYVLGVRQQIIKDKAQLVVAESRLGQR